MAKKETTSFTVSGNLKTALAAKGLLRTPDVNETYYNGANEVHLLIANIGGNLFRCVIKSTSGVDFDLHSTDDQVYVREYATRELVDIIGAHPNVSNLQIEEQGNNKTVTITHNGIARVGISQNIADAHALAFISVLNAS
jgi:hypothetical protein